MPERRPLVLTVYPPRAHYGHEPGEWFYGCDACTSADSNTTSPSKRLTDAELAAEVHAATLAVYRAKVHHEDSAAGIDRMQAMIRFATRPHYDERRTDA